ncbi:hypothetical protein SYNPS1DRAFT_29695 [Syncephalis pseudoplumigaleata]|uniref:EF-hand domain-containing protein n=1 Tax=Syncephalis pseudoplumigaleata TaxID=1712513 RepID=A0A4P9YYA5_9FUNG|nr:hypothetical protein SYNPS1DRAFT_29695 [Syncephalis pseudoplumigaleata]|eukprot:RKP24542.1 hypothetical protein SYNPS1DRAFT_29695 [Syncephalis pseudoplumigaleata]
MDTSGDPVPDIAYGPKSTADTATETAKYLPSGLHPEEDAELLEHVRHVFSELDRDNRNLITTSDLEPLFSRLDKERKLRLNEQAKEQIMLMAEAQGDITITMSQVIDLIPKLRMLAPQSPMARSANAGSLMARSGIPRRSSNSGSSSNNNNNNNNNGGNNNNNNRANPESTSPFSSPLAATRAHEVTSPKSGGRKTGMDLWPGEQLQAEGAEYAYFGSDDENNYRDRHTNSAGGSGRRFLARDLSRLSSDNNQSPTKSRHATLFTRHHRSDSPSLPGSPLSPGVLARRAKFMSNTMETPENYAGEEEMSHADLLNEITNLRREVADYKLRQKESEEHVATMARQHDEAMAAVQQKMDELQGALNVKKRHIVEMQNNEKHHREQIALLENEAQKYAKNIKVLKSQLTKMKTQYEEKCMDEERLFAQLKAKDEELQTSESSIEQLANDQRRSAEERLQLERALRRLENDVLCAQEFEREHELLQKENQELKMKVKQLEAESEERAHRAPVQIPDSLGRASYPCSLSVVVHWNTTRLAVAEAARSGRDLKSEMAGTHPRRERPSLVDLSNMAVHAGSMERRGH